MHSDQKLGRYLVAKCDIPMHTEIFNEHPLIFGPKCFSHSDGNEATLKCVGCFMTIRDVMFACPKCQWPACRPDCPGLTNVKLHGLECPVLTIGNRLNGSDAFRNPSFYRAEALLPLKCLLLQYKFPQKFKDVMAMESHLEDIQKTDLFKEFDVNIVAYLKNNFLDYLAKYNERAKEPILSNLDGLNAQCLHQICGILETNAMCIRLENSEELNGIYKVGCLLEHSCVPNCYFSFDTSNGFKLKVHAGRDIRKDEHLSVMYTHCLWGTQERQEHLRYTKCFQCTCARCSDPTEFGTNFSALKCLGASQQKCPGIQLPIDPLNRESDWKCNSCDVRLGAAQVSDFMHKIESDVDNVVQDEKCTVEQVEAYITKLSDFLHPNHYHLFALKHKLIQLYGFQSGYQYAQLPLDVLDKKIELCQELLNIVKALDAHYLRLSVYAATIALELFMALKETKKRGIDRHQYVGLVADKMKQMLVFGRLILGKDKDVPEAKKLLERIDSELCSL